MSDKLPRRPPTGETYVYRPPTADKQYRRLSNGASSSQARAKVSFKVNRKVKLPKRPVVLPGLEAYCSSEDDNKKKASLDQAVSSTGSGKANAVGGSVATVGATNSPANGRAPYPDSNGSANSEVTSGAVFGPPRPPHLVKRSESPSASRNGHPLPDFPITKKPKFVNGSITSLSSPSSHTWGKGKHKSHKHKSHSEHKEPRKKKKANMSKPTTLREILDYYPSSDEEVNSVDTETQKKETDTTKGSTDVTASDEPVRRTIVCVECEVKVPTVQCKECDDLYCDACFETQHRKGSRLKHSAIPQSKKTIEESAEEDAQEDAGGGISGAISSYFFGGGSKSEEAEEDVDPVFGPARYSAKWFTERAKYIPVRLEMKERKRLRLIKGALAVSEYTTKVDQPTFKSESRRVHVQLQGICAVLSGLSLSKNYEKGQKAVEDRAFSGHKKYFQSVFEIARRYKIMNPEKMRSDYGKLVYMLQDAARDDMTELLGFTTVRPIVTVYAALEKNDCLGVLSHPDLRTATMEILPDGKTRPQVQREIKAKEGAQEKIARAFQRKMSKDAIKWCLYSIGDNFSYLRSNMTPIDNMIGYLKEFFSPTNMKEGFSLAISSGEGGHRLTHNHERQYNYVLQSLTLWKEIADDMFRLWSLADMDLLSPETPYKLTDTGQGHHRLQAASRIDRAMRDILFKTQKRLGSWVGSSVIHLGDTNVPNALMFIDKYTQVSRILSPIIITLKEIDNLMKSPQLTTYIESVFDGPENLRLLILHDFFVNAFDGSGADNFFDAGSCIDGRLTSAWNWCSQLEQKSFFPIFKLTGFIGFDGEFQQ